MNYYELGAGIALAVATIVAVLALHRRVTALESALIVSQQKVADNEITKSVHAFTDAALAVAVASDLGASSTEPTSPVALLSEPAGARKD